MFKSLKWEDWAGIGLGVWLLATPWVFDFSDQQAATVNALVMGTILVLEEMLDLGVHEVAEEWIDLVAGIWLVVSPFVLGFAWNVAATANTVTVGFLTVLFAIFAMSPLNEKFGRWWHDHVTGR